MGINLNDGIEPNEREEFFSFLHFSHDGYDGDNVQCNVMEASGMMEVDR